MIGSRSLLQPAACSLVFFAVVSGAVALSSSSSVSESSKNMSYTVEALTDSKLLGEGPHWDDERQHLYYVDAFKSTIYRYIPAERRETFCKLDDSAVVSIVIPVKNTTDKFAATIGRKLAIVTWDGESTTPQKIDVIATVDNEKGKETNQFNDGKVDPTGKLWIGTLGFTEKKETWQQGKGSLYSFPKGKEPIKHLDGITIANGLDWTSDLKHMYYIDTPTKRVDILDFDAKTGTVANRRTFFDFKDIDCGEQGGPDGMTLDRDDNLWVAVFGAAGVFNIDGKTGKLIRKIDIPSKQTTSVAFGGPNLDELYVVSAKFNPTPEDEKKYPNMGVTFRVTGLGVKGRPAVPADL